MSEEKKGYTTITYRQRFYDKHIDWLCETKILYNKVVQHYYSLLLEHPDLLSMSNFNLMRELEVLTVGTKEMKKIRQKAEYPLLELPVIPLYFRRAAINCAISMIRSAWTREREIGSIAEKFSVAPVYYKGMYKDFQEDSILLKVYTGEKWKWCRYRFVGRKLPKDVETLSPTIYIEEKCAYLHIPVRKVVEDIRSVKERMQSGERILALSFPGSNSIAVGAVLTREGCFVKSIFFPGGLELKAKKKVWKRKWKRQQEIGNTGTRYLKKMEHLNTYYAHLISRRILDFCKEERIGVIVVPHYQRAIDFSKKCYLKTDNFEWIGRRVIRFLKYKAFLEGRIVSKVPIYSISNCCSVCGERIQRYNAGHTPSRNYHGGQLFLCPNGHQGNSGLNTARNVGKKFLSYYKKEFEEL